MGLLESIDDDIDESGLTAAELEAIGLGKINNQNEDDDYDTDEVRERIESRKQQRGKGRDDGDASLDDGGTSRGTSGNASADGKTPPENGETPPVAGEDDAEPTTAAGWAKHRRELREAKAAAAQAAELKAELEKLKATPAAPVADPVVKPPVVDNKPKTIADLGKEPDRNEDLAGWLVWNAESNRIRTEQAEARAAALEQQYATDNMGRQISERITQEHNEFLAKNPDYEPALEHARTEYYKSARRLFPGITDAQINANMRELVVKTALKAKKEGVSAGEALYDLAIEQFGYEPQDAVADNQTNARPARQAPKVDLKVVANNKRRSATAMEGGGQRASQKYTLEQKANMTMNELLALPAEEWDAM